MNEVQALVLDRSLVQQQVRLDEIPAQSRQEKGELGARYI
jgi:hypothetical protein